MLSYFIVIPLLALLILNLPFRRLEEVLIRPAALLLTCAQALAAASTLLGFWDIGRLPASNFFRFALFTDSLTTVFLLCSGMVAFITVLISRQFLNKGEEEINFLSVIFIVLACSNGIALVRDIFSLYVFIEITSIVSFILISFNRERDNLEGAFKYIVLSAVASVLMLTSIALILFISGDTSFALVSLTLATTAHNYLVLAAVGLFLCGLFIKSGLVPFHGWLADAYVAAPAAVSVLLAGIVTKAVGVYALMRLVVDVFPFTPVVQNILFCAGLFSVLLGAFAALAQNDFKRMLSYSSISQVGYIVLGLAAGNPLGLAAAVFHFFNHAVFKSLLFVNCASIEKQIGFRNMDRLGGLAQRMPITGISSAIASLSCAGLPPLAGFWSKLLIIIALWSSGHYFVSLTAALASVLTLAYMLSMQRRVFFGKLREGFLHFKEPAPVLSLAALILTAITIGVGIFFPINLCRIILP